MLMGINDACRLLVSAQHTEPEQLRSELRRRVELAFVEVRMCVCVQAVHTPLVEKEVASSPTDFTCGLALYA